VSSDRRGVVSAESVYFSYGRDPAVEDVSIGLARGQAVGIIGRSGSGKTTLLHILAGLVRPQSGAVFLEGERVDILSEKRRSLTRLRRFGFVFQFGELVPELTLGENVELPLRLLGVDAVTARSEREHVLERLGISELSERKPGEVSGGELQRAAVGRAIIHKPAVVFADEPTGALDSANRDIVWGLLVEASKEIGAAVLVATHDQRIADQLETCYQLESGRLTVLSPH